MFTRVFADQPVWDWIGQQAPDRLLLLGDSLYLDLLVDGPHPELMDEVTFAEHLFTLYTELMTQPQFATLVSTLPPGSVNAIWDDHDFLWDDADGAELGMLHSGKIRLSTAFHERFRIALAQALAPDSFPQSHDDAVFWDPDQPPLSTPSIQLAPDVWLHLTDGRSHRTRRWLLRESRRTLFGAAQKDAFAAAIDGAPQALHLWASGSTIAGYQHFGRDLDWLKDLASRQRMLVLSGNIHRNELDAFFTNGFPLHEATSSGAAVRDAVIVGAQRQNYGLLDIDDGTVTIRLFKGNRLQHQRVLDRQSWLPV
jgi:alkaline phosphatase D